MENQRIKPQLDYWHKVAGNNAESQALAIRMGLDPPVEGQDPPGMKLSLE